MKKNHSNKITLRRIVELLLSRLVVFGVLIFIQFLIVVGLIFGLAENSAFVYPILEILSICVTIWVVSKDDNPSYKIAWVIVIASVPVCGGLFYLMWGNKRIPDDLVRRIRSFYETTVEQLPTHSESETKLLAENTQLGTQSKYISDVSGFPVHAGTQADYLPLGEAFFEALKTELKQAKSFILMEYFIIEEGEMWNPIFDILKEKAKEGVDVRFIYDDMGCLQTIPSSYSQTMLDAGIKTAVFNPFRPHLNMAMNYRDHRKICVIDGNTGFCGGINLADEYINAYDKHGHWKDTAVMLRGAAVWNLTLMFLIMWNFTTGESLDYKLYQPTKTYPDDGYVQPFGDSPLDNLNVSENAYMHIINRACKYVYITTPYLILDNEMVNALSMAAQSGIDVRIITPHVADKWYVHIVTRSYYKSLIAAGVRIFEYTPGFIHAKMFVSDDDVAIVGTTNLDYRSLYLHFECGVAFFGSSVVTDVKSDILHTLSQCDEVTLDELNALPFHTRALAAIIRLFAPLM